ncbi:MAG: methylmalonyl-CoA epimerase [Anaerolineales bacterium]
MTRIKRIDHVAIVVDDIDDALDFWQKGLGLRISHVEDVPDQDSAVAFLPTGDSEVELVRPTSGESGIARYLQKYGPGMHHICFEVDDIEAALAQLRQRSIRLINDEPVIGTGGKKIAFVHPESANGVLVELYELTALEPEIRFERASRLADRALTSGQAMAAGVLAFLRALTEDRKSAPDPYVTEDHHQEPT